MQRVSVQSINSFSNEIITEMGRIYFILNKRNTAELTIICSVFFVKKKTTGYARSTKKAMPMRRKNKKKVCKSCSMVE